MLVITSYVDVRTREIDPRIWLPFLVVGLVLSIYRFSLDPAGFVVYLGLSMVPPLVLLSMSFVGMMGLADPIAMALVSLLVPRPFVGSILPPSMVILVISSILITVFLVIPIVVLNLRNIREIWRICGSTSQTFLVYATAFPITAEKFIRTKFLYPLIYPALREGSLSWTCRGSFNIDEDPGTYRRSVKELMEKGLLTGKERIYVTWGVPFIVFLLLGALTYPVAGPLIETAMGTLIRVFLRMPYN
ncbi:MAG: A24 family peptidase C-terminal domain-containing protein [Desulfurococcales archaeon]|jgi:hypothetical protein|nr:A24 family peptidase C-terminal domain-containing protein [Desulfurococcales archaeon]